MSARVRLPSCLTLLSLIVLLLTACASDGGRQHASKGPGALAREPLSTLIEGKSGWSVFPSQKIFWLTSERAP